MSQCVTDDLKWDHRWIISSCSSAFSFCVATVMVCKYLEILSGDQVVSSWLHVCYFQLYSSSYQCMTNQ